ncbi:peroxisomal sarcosine oxidase-like [Scleropages formosus]|uniref:Peroxisomal sarcosine oxidase-like n=1 Tax=Scleropages formosus TaxID=113540 RepID=A0A0P7X6M0_SCLFO|nr:peroxisomal sarcosine oxidase-like [Scleropages formosus]
MSPEGASKRDGMASHDFDCIVIGAGIQGSFTAYHLAKKKKKTLLLEQFVLPHSRGSSHGQTRIIRKTYEEDFYVHMMEESYQLWSQLEAEAGVQLHRWALLRTALFEWAGGAGLLVLGPEKASSFQDLKRTMEQNHLPNMILRPKEFSQHIPNMNLANGEGAIVDMSAGVLYADRALRAVQGVFQSLGGEIKDREKVVGITPGTVVTVTTGSGAYRAKSLVITAGPWANTLLSLVGLKLPLQVLKINVCYWKEKIPGTYSLASRFPSFIQLGFEGAESEIYGLPSNEYPGLMKVCYHSGSPTDPDERDRQTERKDITLLSSYIARRLPGLETVPAVVESCMYTVTPDHNFILDSHPSHNNIVIGAGFSGQICRCSPTALLKFALTHVDTQLHTQTLAQPFRSAAGRALGHRLHVGHQRGSRLFPGMGFHLLLKSPCSPNYTCHGFKFGPVVGKVLSELSLGQMPSYDLSPFRIQRFQTPVLSKL